MASQGKPGNRVVHLECTRPSQMAHRSQNQVGGHVADLSSVPHVSEWKTLGDKGHPDNEQITHADIERATNEIRRLKGFTEYSKWRK